MNLKEEFFFEKTGKESERDHEQTRVEDGRWEKSLQVMGSRGVKES